MPTLQRLKHTHTQNTHVPTRYIAFGHERSAHLFRNFEGFLYEVDDLYSPPYICLVEIFACDYVGCVFLLHLS